MHALYIYNRQLTTRLPMCKKSTLFFQICDKCELLKFVEVVVPQTAKDVTGNIIWILLKI